MCKQLNILRVEALKVILDGLCEVLDCEGEQCENLVQQLHVGDIECVEHAGEDLGYEFGVDVPAEVLDERDEQFNDACLHDTLRLWIAQVTQ